MEGSVRPSGGCNGSRASRSRRPAGDQAHAEVRCPRPTNGEKGSRRRQRAAKRIRRTGPRARQERLRRTGSATWTWWGDRCGSPTQRRRGRRVVWRRRRDQARSAANAARRRAHGVGVNLDVGVDERTAARRSPGGAEVASLGRPVRWASLDDRRPRRGGRRPRARGQRSRGAFPGRSVAGNDDGGASNRDRPRTAPRARGFVGRDARGHTRASGAARKQYRTTLIPGRRPAGLTSAYLLPSQASASDWCWRRWIRSAGLAGPRYAPGYDSTLRPPVLTKSPEVEAIVAREAGRGLRAPGIRLY